MNLSCRLDYHRFPFPTTETPSWANQVERWYQADAPAYGLCELYSRYLVDGPRPKMIFLASPAGSNATDFSFAQSGATSPAKFAHTLPNIRATGLLQVMNWQGPLLCLQTDPTTITGALCEAAEMASRGPVWIFAYHQAGSEHATFCFQIGGEGNLRVRRVEDKGRSPLIDSEFIQWLQSADLTGISLNEMWTMERVS